MALTTIIPTLPNNISSFTKPQSVSHLSNGISTDINSVEFPLQVGVPVQNIYTFKIIPTAISANCVADTQNFGTGANGGNLTLRTTAQGTAPNIFSQPIVFLGQSGVLLDCERILRLNFSDVTTTATVVTVTGYDYRGVAIQYTTATLPVGSPSQNIGVPISVVTSINFSTNPFTGDASKNIFVGASNCIGLPYLLTNSSYAIYNSWAGATLASQTAASIVPGYNWRANGAYGTYSARGYVNTGTTNNPNGTFPLIITYYVYGSDSELNGEIVNRNQSSLKIASIQKNTSSSYPTPQFVLPHLVKEDLTGIQVNPNVTLASGTGGDADFFIAYKAAIAA